MQLCRHTLPRVQDTVSLPEFDPSHLRPGIVHLGCGNFHRAHQVAATQAAIGAMGREGLGWGIVSATMRKPDLAQALGRQDNLYALLTRGPRRTVATVMASITDTVFARAKDTVLAQRIADPRTRIVTLTVTASGYYLTAQGRLDSRAEAVRSDLAADRPRTAVGILARGLALVRKRGGVPPVILCCDNLSENGQTLRQAVMDFASLRGNDALAEWIGASVQFPDSMVDRIVPTPTAVDRDDARRLLGGLSDVAPVSAEPWFQWIIGRFDGDRPRWEAHTGTRFVPDVGVFERAKLQMLNGTHMLLAYAGALAGLDTVAAAASDPAVGALAARFMRLEQGADVALDEAELDEYAVELMQRFRNAAIAHRVERVGRNGSAKLVARALRPMRANLEAGVPVAGAHLLVASWIRWFILHERGVLGFAPADPRLETLVRLCATWRGDHQALVAAILAREDIAGSALPRHESQVEAIASLLDKFENAPATVVFAELARQDSVMQPLVAC
jgi:fructuronate reductase